jgi:hypothetical protein
MDEAIRKTEQPIFVKAKQLSSIIGLPISTIHDLKQRRVLPSYQLPGCKGVYYKPAEVVSIFEAGRVNDQGCI